MADRKVVELPTGEHRGETVGYWFGELHTAEAFGLPYRILSILGGVIVNVLITGAIVWAKRRSARSL